MPAGRLQPPVPPGRNYHEAEKEKEKGKKKFSPHIYITDPYGLSGNQATRMYIIS